MLHPVIALYSWMAVKAAKDALGAMQSIDNKVMMCSLLLSQLRERLRSLQGNDQNYIEAMSPREGKALSLVLA